MDTNKNDNLSSKLDLNQQDYLKKLNYQYDFHLTDYFISNKCTLEEYLHFVKEAAEMDRKFDQINNEPARKIRPIDSEGNARK